MQSSDWVVYGAGLSALALAERLGTGGRRVTLLNPAKSWGGVFRGVTIGDATFDAGMTNFEFELFGEPSDNIERYDADCKPDIGRYVHLVRRYLSDYVDVEPLPTPQMIHGDCMRDDLIITNQFDILGKLPDSLRTAIRQELEVCASTANALHPRLKNAAGSPLESASFEAASLANHGPTFHGLFVEPMFRKVLGVPTSEVKAVFHRSGWAPLFYPETLLSQFGPTPQRLKPTVFHYPRDRHFGAFIDRMVAKVRSLPNVTIETSVSGAQIDANSRRVLTAQGEYAFDRLAWGGELAQLMPQASLTPTRRASLDLFFLRVRSDGVRNRFPVLIDPQSVSPFYRVTNQTVCRQEADTDTHQIIVECNSANWSEHADDSRARFHAALERYGIEPGAVIDRTHRSFAGALAIPAHEQIAPFNALRDAFTQQFPYIHLMGASRSCVSSTLNDHLIQALQIAHSEGALA
ncbi:NAD(P)-binding Rossmann-like domain-containing protein [Paraburkholderia fungorum]|uniref:NAD(P)-binding Rossmann-like domain-containing protein n=2 Tax=Paraburkholderia fungorum TaxID=134537 RepID=A0A1H0YMJ3_9BURK|nr:NAD(P)-binding protein [Paraburkholderia fungorum]SDQ16389.1 NAD(P)-binding Rossmann-like domain-containing protein [Paraburkholderia fungorum]